MQFYREDGHRCQVAVDKLVQFVKEHGTTAQHKRALEVQLPTSPIYDFLEGRLPHPSHTYVRLAEITENEEKEQINREIGERRTRLGARIVQVTADVKREVYDRSSLEALYQSVIDWSNDDGVRREYEEKLLQRAYDTLAVLPPDRKPPKRQQVMKMAHGMVIIKHPFDLAWRIELEWTDIERLEGWDVGVLRDFVEYFPDKGVSKVLKGYLSSELSPFPTVPKQVEDAEEDRDISISLEERLLLMTVGYVFEDQPRHADSTRTVWMMPKIPC